MSVEGIPLCILPLLSNFTYYNQLYKDIFVLFYHDDTVDVVYN